MTVPHVRVRFSRTIVREYDIRCVYPGYAEHAAEEDVPADVAADMLDDAECRAESETAFAKPGPDGGDGGTPARRLAKAYTNHATHLRQVLGVPSGKAAIRKFGRYEPLGE